MEINKNDLLKKLQDQSKFFFTNKFYMIRDPLYEIA